jgi:SAM-dependent methyltransferase
VADAAGDRGVDDARRGRSAGNAPLLPVLAAGRYVGVDVSAAELALARRRGTGLLVRGSASALPLADGSVEVVACSMALQVLTPLPAVLAEVARVLAPGGRLVATVPDRGPLRAGDVPIIAALLATLGRGLGYPNDRLLRGLPDPLATVGLRLVADERRRFAYPLATAVDAEVFLASLYLPGLSAWRHRAARVLLRAATAANCPARPMRSRTAARWRTTSNPATRAVPESGRSRVARMRIRVVFPAPLGPSSP